MRPSESFQVFEGGLLASWIIHACSLLHGCDSYQQFHNLDIDKKHFPRFVVVDSDRVGGNTARILRSLRKKGVKHVVVYTGDASRTETSDEMRSRYDAVFAVLYEHMDAIVDTLYERGDKNSTRNKDGIMGGLNKSDCPVDNMYKIMDLLERSQNMFMDMLIWALR